MKIKNEAIRTIIFNIEYHWYRNPEKVVTVLIIAVKSLFIMFSSFRIIRNKSFMDSFREVIKHY